MTHTRSKAAAGREPSPLDYSSLTPADWQRVEGLEHDRIYSESIPQPIDVSCVWAYEDYCYVPGARRDRGHRTRRALELAIGDGLEDKDVLDVGCGDGRYAVFLALHGARVTGFDISAVGVQRAVELAAANHLADKCRFTVENASAMPYADRSFDVVLLHEVLHHIIKYPHVHEEVLRVVRPGGRVVVTESLYGNPLVNWARKFTMSGHEAQGDVVLRLEDIRDFATGFSSHSVELMSLTFMAKRVVERWVHWLPVRTALYGLKRFDDALLALAPGLRRYCGECVALFVR